MGVFKIFHGSDHIVKKPAYLGGKPDNVYGNGFYATEVFLRQEDKATSWH